MFKSESAKRRFRLILKWSLASFFLFLLFFWQTSSSLLIIGGVRPYFLLIAAVIVATFEPPLPAAVYGFAAGLLWDYGSDRIFGLHTVFLVAVAALVSMVFSLYIRRRMVSSLTITMAAGGLYLLFDMLFSYVIWGYEGAEIAALSDLLPGYIVTALIFPLFWWLGRTIHDRLTPKAG